MNIQWNAADYESHFSFVHQYGESVTELITAPEGSFVVDLGCGSGALTEKLRQQGYRVLGIDASPDMIRIAQRLHPDLSFIQADALSFSLPEPADVIFSNAVFHWIDADKQSALLQNTAHQLRTGGELVCEFGGFGCAETVHAALETNFRKAGYAYPRVFYFPTIGEYAPLLEKQGLQVRFATLFDRPTEQEGEDGLAGWIRMFVKKPLESIPAAEGRRIVQQTVEDLRPVLYQKGKWIVDYVRIRLRAVKI